MPNKSELLGKIWGIQVDPINYSPVQGLLCFIAVNN